MASSSTTSPDTLVTIKATLDGASRRFKLPLRELGVNVLESKLRLHLGIPAGADVIFERYSDSAASYVVLDRTNISVWKQLGRAAKAKQKLKIRVTSKQETPAPVEEKKGPKPASVEDEAEDEVPTPHTAEAVEPISEPKEPSVTLSSFLAEKEKASEVVPERSEERLRNNILASMESTLEALQATMAATATSKNPPTCPAARAFSTPPPFKTARTNYAVCCNSCDRTIPDLHYHCSTCDDGDFDLCQDCVDQGKSCNGNDHWLIKRFVKHGVIINSTTQRIASKAKAKPQPTEEATPAPSAAPAPLAPPAVLAAPALPATRAAPLPHERIMPLFNDFLYSSIRTCNCCVQELPEVEFVHCTTCDDFDLCRACFAKNRHGHHPKHAFVPAVEGTRLEPEVSRRLSAGRDQSHNAICDGCDEGIKGIRHKCLDCPDWDYCSTCVVNSSFIHPGHRFVPIFEPLELASSACIRAFSRPTHAGICCDGPLCTSARTSSTYIVGDRYKCAVCDDTDFCANCEASPANNHNKTHPLIKFKTPVRHVSVTTTGEHESGRVMPAMGDRLRSRPSVTSSRSTETASQKSLFSNIQTVVDVKPSEPATKEEVKEVKEEVKEVKEEDKEVKNEEVEEKSVVREKTPAPQELVAVFVRDTVADGTVFGPNEVFEQTWVLRNDGPTAWPAGCSVKYVGGDYMGHVDSNHPAATEDLESSSESNICTSTILPGDEYPFTVLLRTPQRSGRIVSNWRLTTKDGLKFGHRLWCDVVVENRKSAVPVEEEKQASIYEPVDKEAKPEDGKTEAVETQQSQMIFPKLDKESPAVSIHGEIKSEKASSYEDEYEDCAEDDEWAEDDSEAFLTDEEYDILDASDEEYHEGHQLKK
jgi:next-to-BRCA1 protein 1